MKDTADALVTKNQYFMAFEKTFRIQNIALENNWKDNLTNVIEMGHADWYANTIEADHTIGYVKAKALIMDHVEPSTKKAINMFNIQQTCAH